MSTSALEALQQLLSEIPSGPVSDERTVAAVENALAQCWYLLQGHDGGMRGGKLRERMESVTWDPPNLVFTIERHRGTVHGSARAELQQWTVDIRKAEATYIPKGSRVVGLTSPPLDVKPLAARAVELILEGEDHEWLKWREDRTRVTVRSGKIIPAEGTCKQTLAARRKRLGKELRQRLEDAGWQLVEGTTAHTYEFARGDDRT